MVEQALESSSPESAPPRRATPRATLQVEVTLQGDDNFFSGLATNVSSGGLFVATYTPRPLGSSIALELRLPGRPELIQTTAQVRWVRAYSDGGDGVPGMGLQFLALCPADEAAIAHFVAQRAPIFWDDEQERTPLATTFAPTEGGPRLEPEVFGPESFAPVPLQHGSRAFRVGAALGGAVLAAGLVFAALQTQPRPSMWEAFEASAAAPLAAASSPSVPVPEAPPAAAETSPELAPIAPVALESAAAPDPVPLAPTEGWLLFARSEAASVYVNGKLLGSTNTPLRALCGLKNVRLAQPTREPTKVPDWLGAGRPVSIPCGVFTRVEP
jgi:uncharacterized protein (TIGR02266 family)